MASISQLSARLVDLFGPSSSANPTKLLGNLGVSPGGNVIVGAATSTDNGSDKLQVAGPVKITGGNALGFDGANTSYKIANYYTSGSVRWAQGVDTTSESGSNAGSNWFINRYSDTGVYIDTPVKIARSTGVLTSTSGFTSVSTVSWVGDGYAQYRAVYGNYGVMFRNDGTTFYLLTTPSGTPYGSWNTLRPFAFNLASGAVTIDGSGAGVAMGSRPTWQLGGSGSYYTAIDSQNIGSQSVNYANSAGSASTAGSCSGNAATASSVGGVSSPVGTGSSAQLANLHVNVGGGNVGNQGGNMSWNDGNGDGATWFANNQGGGSGGFILRTVNVNNTVEIGRFTISASGTGTNGSDIRLKEDIKPLEDSLAKIRSIRGVSYKYKASGEKHYGVIAQEVQPYFPDCVTFTHFGEDDPSGHEHANDLLGVCYTDLIAPLIESVKELANKVDAQSEEIASLKAQLGKQ